MSKRKIMAVLFAVIWTGYMAYSVFNQSGLYALAISWQNKLFGSYYSGWTDVLLWMVPIMVVFGKLSPESFQPAPVEEGATPEMVKLANVEKSTRVIGWLSAIGLAISAAALAIGLNLPEKGAPPTVVNFAMLAEETPRGRVEIEGNVITEAMAGIEQTLDGRVTTIAYAPIVALDATELGIEAVPLQYFQKVESDGTAWPAEAFFTRIGYLKQEALPVLVREVYAKEEMVVAETTYVLDSKALDWRETMFLIASVVGLIAFMMISVWIVCLIQRRKFRKTATLSVG